ncbi:MAG: hypothetical protein AAGA93_10705 [Actinomycetota bacterium]
MLTHRDRVSTRLLTAIGVIVAVAVIGFAVRNTMVGAVQPSAEFEVDGVAYRFTPSTCTITDSGFVTAGSGELDGEDFWIAISPDGAELALGTDDEMTRSEDENDLWLVAVDQVTWDAVDANTVEADVVMGDARAVQAPEMLGHASVTCASR